jgi:uncharacterized protein YndB with AHSA1/START domain
MWKRIAIAAVLLVAILAAVVATRPSTFRVERSATAAAPPEAVYAQIADFHRWAAWSPWEKLDPGMKKDFAGPAVGQGAGYHWSGNDKVGEGRMTVTAATPGEQVVIQLEFLKPWASTSTTTFRLAPEGAGTRVTWSMEGHHDFMGKAFSLFMDMDKMIGSDFERGLAQLAIAAANR